MIESIDTEFSEKLIHWWEKKNLFTWQYNIPVDQQYEKMFLITPERAFFIGECRLLREYTWFSVVVNEEEDIVMDFQIWLQ